MSKKHNLSKEKHKELTEELDFLKTKRRKEIAEKLEYAKSLGDLSENAEYHEAREDQANTERRIIDLEALLKDVEVVKKHHSEEVEIGSVVVVQKEGEKEKEPIRSLVLRRRTPLKERSQTCLRSARHSWARKRGDCFFPNPRR